MNEKELENRLALCENRYRTLLEICNAIASNLEKDLLFRAIAEQIKKVLTFDRTGITIYNPPRDHFTIYVLETSISPLHLKPGMEIPHKGSAIGWVLDHRRYHIRNDLDQERSFIEDELFFKEGLRTILNLPLMNRGIVLGTFNISSKTPYRYSESEIGFLGMVADQIAVALDNSLAYEEIKNLKNRLNEEKLYLQEEREEWQKGLTLEEVERSHILEILKRTQGVIGGSRGAAKILNMHPNTLRSRMDKLGIKRDRKDLPRF